MSFGAGLFEAITLILLVNVGLAVAGGDERIDAKIGPFGAIDFGVAPALTIAIVITLVGLGLQFVSARLMARMSAEVLTSERSGLFRSFLDAPWPTKAEYRGGRLQELFSSHASKSATAVDWVAVGCEAAFSLSALLIAALVIEPLAMLGAVAVVLVLYALIRPLTASGRKFAAIQARDGISLSTRVTEEAGLALETTIFDVREQVYDDVTRQIGSVSDSYRRMKFVGKMVPDLFRTSAFLIILVALGVASRVGASAVAPLGAVMLLLLRGLGYAQILQRMSVQLSQLSPFLDQLSDERDGFADIEIGVADATSGVDSFNVLEFDDVSFEYSADAPALRSLSAEFSMGETIGLIGPSGSGKSTFLQLLLRLRDPTSGAIRLDGRDLADFDRRDWFRSTAVVSQETRLFSSSIRANIDYHRSLPDEAIERAARAAHIHDEIMATPLGYGSDIGEQGGRMSGGQRQRLALARALAGQPRILFLDEPTSALDVISEARIKESLEEIRGTALIFIIAHRLSTIELCDRVMILESGRLVAFDSQEQLAGTSSFYRAAESINLGAAEEEPEPSGNTVD